MLQSWGYDTDGKPIPNESGNTDRFAKNWLLESSKWPVGPVDLRFDRINLQIDNGLITKCDIG